jgi:8-oxo-dGTP diphosphatase
MHERARFTLSARLVLLEDGRVLLARHRHADGRDFWCFPGGGVEAGETPVAAARREAREELGLEVEPLGVCHLLLLGDRLDLFFLVRRIAGEATLGGDPERSGGPAVLQAIAWAPLAELDRFAVLPVELAQRLRREPDFTARLLPPP